MFFTFIKKNCKNMQKTLNYSIHSSKKNLPFVKTKDRNVLNVIMQP